MKRAFPIYLDHSRAPVRAPRDTVVLVAILIFAAGFLAGGIFVGYLLIQQQERAAARIGTPWHDR